MNGNEYLGDFVIPSTPSRPAWWLDGAWLPAFNGVPIDARHPESALWVNASVDIPPVRTWEGVAHNVFFGPVMLEGLNAPVSDWWVQYYLVSDPHAPYTMPPVHTSHYTTDRIEFSENIVIDNLYFRSSYSIPEPSSVMLVCVLLVFLFLFRKNS